MIGMRILILIILGSLLILAACAKPPEKEIKPTEEIQKPIPEEKPPQPEKEAKPKPEIKPEEKKPEVVQPKIKPAKQVVNCNECHKNVEKFHYIPILRKIQEAKNKSKRDCTTCHGKVEMVHEIHKRKLETGKIKCETCHMVGGKLVIPKKLPNQTYVCERCHNGGNFVTIHKQRCDRCHPKNIGAIHLEATKRALVTYEELGNIKIPKEDYKIKPCSDCHTRLQGIHYLNITSTIDAIKKIPERNCTTCHGPVKYVHIIHKRVLEEGKVKCQTCHLFKEYTYIVPKKKPYQKVVCQLCHFEGNLIKVHKGICSRCHYGSLGDIHKQYTEKVLRFLKE